jgi:hypothetical protein
MWKHALWYVIWYLFFNKIYLFITREAQRFSRIHTSCDFWLQISVIEIATILAIFLNILKNVTKHFDSFALINDDSFPQ